MTSDWVKNEMRLTSKWFVTNFWVACGGYALTIIIGECMPRGLMLRDTMWIYLLIYPFFLWDSLGAPFHESAQ